MRSLSSLSLNCATALWRARHYLSTSVAALALMISIPVSAQPAAPAATAQGMSGYECPPGWRRRPDPLVPGKRFGCYGTTPLDVSGRQCPDGMRLMRSANNLHFSCTPENFDGLHPVEPAPNPAASGTPAPQPVAPTSEWKPVTGYNCPGGWQRNPPQVVPGQPFTCSGRFPVPQNSRQCPDGLKLQRHQHDMGFSCQ
ncbi:MAG: hypothetical protein REI94_03420 [Moraxellaceae bacterium]|nr:hypothetical protein [Moraxellaceae bacterium]